MSKNYLAVALMLVAMTTFLVGCEKEQKAATDALTNQSQEEMKDDAMKAGDNMEKDSMMDDEEMMEDDKMDKDGDSMMKDGDSMEKDSMKDGGAMMAGSDFMIASGTTASYVVNKGWLNKAAEEVVGTTSSVSGTFKYDAQADTVSDLVVEIDSQTFDSGSGGRDKEVRALFNGPITVKTDSTIKAVDGQFSTTIPMMLTINGTTKKIDFKVSGTATDSSLSAEGTGSFKMTEFGIKPFSAAGVYNVADEMSVKFNLKSAAK